MNHLLPFSISFLVFVSAANCEPAKKLGDEIPLPLKASDGSKYEVVASDVPYMGFAMRYYRDKANATAVFLYAVDTGGSVTLQFHHGSVWHQLSKSSFLIVDKTSRLREQVLLANVLHNKIHFEDFTSYILQKAVYDEKAVIAFEITEDSQPSVILNAKYRGEVNSTVIPITGKLMRELAETKPDKEVDIPLTWSPDVHDEMNP